MIIAVPKETYPGERRVALVPASIPALVKSGERVRMEAHAGLAAGFLDEVRALHQRGDLTDAHPAVRAVGYRQIWAHLDGAYSLDTAQARAVAATRQLAKRQMTWLRSMANIQVVDPYDPQRFVGIRESLVRAFCLL